MKKFTVFVYVILLVLFVSCEKELFFNFGFDSQIEKKSNGLVIADISKDIQNIRLEGLIEVSDGEVEVYLFNPDGIAVFSETIIAPNELKINKTFEANQGYWKLKYKSNNGLGTIDLHIYKY